MAMLSTVVDWAPNSKETCNMLLHQEISTEILPPPPSLFEVKLQTHKTFPLF